jgi:orotidine-5'-phosphate decarboxylase
MHIRYLQILYAAWQELFLCAAQTFSGLPIAYNSHGLESLTGSGYSRTGCKVNPEDCTAASIAVNPYQIMTNTPKLQMTNTPINAKDKIVVALDVPDRDSALALVEKLSGLVGMFKIGKQLFTAAGPSLVREIIAAGEKVFLDLKYHDIPNTVAGAAQSAATLGVSIFNIHTLGGSEMMRAAVQATQNLQTRPAVLGVTVLTSMNDTSLAEVGIPYKADEMVIRLATLARDAGLNGVVASAKEIRLIREKVASENFIILTPGIRPVWSASGDQKRIATPADALRDGADFIVIGRAITDGNDPRANAERVLEEVSK